MRVAHEGAVAVQCTFGLASHAGREHDAQRVAGRDLRLEFLEQLFHALVLIEGLQDQLPRLLFALELAVEDCLLRLGMEIDLAV